MILFYGILKHGRQSYMRIKIVASLDKPAFIPFNYQYQMHAAIINIIQKSSSEYATFLHDDGFKYKKNIDDDSGTKSIQKIYKYYTFSNLKLFPKILTKGGFNKVRKVEIIFSTSIDKSFEHVVLGLFADNKFSLQFSKDNRIVFQIEHVETLPEPEFTCEEKFYCLSPVLVTTQLENGKHHCLDYMIPEERERFVRNLKQNLIHKYEGLYGKEFNGSEEFEFSFDPVYIAKRNGKISKLIKVNKGSVLLKFKGFQAPFTIKADSELIKIGYEAGFGNNNALGWGCVDLVNWLK